MEEHDAQLPSWTIVAAHFAAAMVNLGKDVLGYPRLVENDDLAARYGDPTQEIAFVHWFDRRGRTMIQAGPQRTLELCGAFSDDPVDRSAILVLALLRTIQARRDDPFDGEAWIFPHSPTSRLAYQIKKTAEEHLFHTHGYSPSSDLWHLRSTNVLPAWKSAQPRAIEAEQWTEIMDRLASEAVSLMTQVDAMVVTTTQAGRDKARAAVHADLERIEERLFSVPGEGTATVLHDDDTEEAPTPC